MHRSHLGMAVLLALVVGAAGHTADKDKDKNAADKKKDDMVSAGEVLGRVAHVESAAKGFRIEVPVQVPNPAAMLQMANLQRQLAMSGPQQRMNLAMQIAQQQRNMFRTEVRPLDLEPIEGMIVRMKNPPLVFDEKGKPKKYTQKELKELKGDDPKLPGYQADFDSIRMGQIVQVVLTKKKPEKPVGKAKPVKKEDAEFLNEERPLVKMVLIVAEPPPP